MVSAPANVRRHFLPWDGPLLPQVVGWLAKDWAPAGPLDLSRILAVVPTRNAGRRLRESLAVHAHERGRAVFPPLVATPETLAETPAEASPAERLPSLLAWSNILRRLNLEEFRDVFPIDPPARAAAWGLRLAQQMSALQATLAEAGLRLVDVPRLLGEGTKSFGELERWRQLAEMEARYDAELAAAGLRDPQAVKIQSARQLLLPADAERVVLVATPDPWPLALEALASLPASVPVDVLVFAPEEEADAFDAWGRPRVSAWSRRALELPDFGARVHVRIDPEAQAEQMAGWAAAYGDTAGLFAIGTADPETLPAMEGALETAAVAHFNPQGRSRRDDELYHLLAALAALAADPSFADVEALGRCPAFLAAARRRFPGTFATARWLEGLDQLRAWHLPVSFAAARAQSALGAGGRDVAEGLALMADLRSALEKGSFAASAEAALAVLFSGASVDRSDHGELAFEQSAGAWMEVLRECAAAGPAGLTRGDWWDLALRLFGEQRRNEEKPRGALELQGWLELLWEEAPHLAVAGCNDGRLPEAVTADPFLPDALRERLGLKTNAGRLARDAYFLQALACSRGHQGRLDLVFGKNSAKGEPQRPSRLLLQCPDAELPARVADLFRPVEAAAAHLAWTRAWRLEPPPVAPQAVDSPGAGRRVAVPTRISVTALRAWLECPFRFYLRHVLAMEAVDPAKNEMEATDFGTLCHAALEGMALEPALRDCCDPAVLRDFLLAELERQARRRFGAELSLPLVVQLESARQRLSRAAEVQAAERAAGWRIEWVERKTPIRIAGLDVIAKIDRIDRHVETGAVRVLDYKTSDAAVTPAAAHFRPRRAKDLPRPWATFEWEGKPQVWIDLQLALYRQALAEEFPGPLSCGYFNLPKAAAGTGLSWWEPYPAELHAAAIRCAEGVCGAIGAGEFWPPAEELRRQDDPFAALFHHGAAASIRWEAPA